MSLTLTITSLRNKTKQNNNLRKEKTIVRYHSIIKIILLAYNPTVRITKKHLTTTSYISSVNMQANCLNPTLQKSFLSINYYDFASEARKGQ